MVVVVEVVVVMIVVAVLPRLGLLVFVGAVKKHDDVNDRICEG